jgi:hypothetical protein
MAYFLVVLLLTLSGCAATTSVVLLDPAKQYSSSMSVAILLRPPERPYVEIAKLETKGAIGEPEPTLYEQAREKAAAIGADAIIIADTASVYHPPVVVHDAWWPYYGPWYRDRWYGHRFWHLPPPYPFYPYTTLPGGNAYTVRSIAIKYR